MRRWTTVLAFGLLVTGAALVLWWLWPGGQSTEEAGPALASQPATTSAATTSTSETAPPSTTTSTDSVDLDGRWEVAEGSAASYRVVEDPSSLVSFEATGETTDMDGWAQISDTTITEATFSTKVRSIISDQPSRDRVFHNEVLEADRFPTIDFALVEPIELGAIPSAGAAVSTTVVGSLTLHGVTRQVTFPADAAVSEDRVDVAGTIDIAMDDFDIDPLDTVVLRVKDRGTVSIELLLTRP